MKSETTGTRDDHREGIIARTIEGQTAKLPSDTFLWASLGSMATSFLLQSMGKKEASLLAHPYDTDTHMCEGYGNRALLP